jgi:hypothetical protein
LKAESLEQDHSINYVNLSSPFLLARHFNGFAEQNPLPSKRKPQELANIDSHNTERQEDILKPILAFQLRVFNEEISPENAWQQTIQNIAYSQLQG